MITLPSFYDHLLPELPGCATAMLNLHMRAVAREFCSASRAWRADFTAVDTVADQAAYTLVTGQEESALVAVHKLTVNDSLLFDDGYKDDGTTDAPEYDRNAPPFTISDDLLTITLIEDEIPTDAATGGLVITGSLQPTVGGSTLPDLLYHHHLDGFRAGVLSRLMAMPNKPWTALAQAGLYGLQYTAHLQHAATDAQRGNTRTLLRTRKWG